MEESIRSPEGEAKAFVRCPLGVLGTKPWKSGACSGSRRQGNLSVCQHRKHHCAWSRDQDGGLEFQSQLCHQVRLTSASRCVPRAFTLHFITQSYCAGSEIQFRGQRESWIEEGRTCFCLLSQATVSSGSSVPFQGVRSGDSYMETSIPQFSQITGLVTRIQVESYGKAIFLVFIAPPSQHASFQLGAA